MQVISIAIIMQSIKNAVNAPLLVSSLSIAIAIKTPIKPKQIVSKKPAIKDPSFFVHKRNPSLYIR